MKKHNNLFHWAAFFVCMIALILIGILRHKNIDDEFQMIPILLITGVLLVLFGFLFDYKKNKSKK